MKIIAILAILLAFNFFLTSQVSSKENGKNISVNGMEVKVPTAGNSWFFLKPDAEDIQVLNIRSVHWDAPDLTYRTFFRIEEPGELHIGIRAMAEKGITKLIVVFNGSETEIEIEISSHEYSNIYIGSFEIDEPGYKYLDIKGISTESAVFADISDVLLGGSATQGGIHYINEEYFYWGRRGPSVHLTYEVPQQSSSVQYFYNEVTVPEGNDVIGSFFMANGFGQGYFGFQVNSPTERRILFSVWSPYQTDNPEEIPEDQRVELLRKGENVTVNDFGNEGSGGQSYLVYNWEAGKTYRFLLKGEPAAVEANKTDFTAWFSSEEGKWLLIASWRRPLTETYLTRVHSFLENFNTRTGPIERMAFYNNQWILDTSGNWHELNRARFTADATARDKARLDYAGGFFSNDDGFYMKNCGFFDETAPLDDWHTRPYLDRKPIIDFSQLP
ncbi:MAG: DUF3472 domain-containing protein [Bacteroidales bacterium]|nr:DUF3472 domain-containing protein [Bacteroidales bacterium]